MLDQSFSAKNFETIFTLLNRQGKMEIDAMSEDYRSIVGEIHAVNEEIKLLCRKKKTLRTEDEVVRLSELQESLSSLRYKKSETLTVHMEALADEVNSRLFTFNITTSVFDGKEEFMLDDSLAASYAMKQLQHNLKRTFKYVFRYNLGVLHRMLTIFHECISTICVGACSRLRLST